MATLILLISLWVSFLHAQVAVTPQPTPIHARCYQTSCNACLSLDQRPLFRSTCIWCTGQTSSGTSSALTVLPGCYLGNSPEGVSCRASSLNISSQCTKDHPNQPVRTLAPTVAPTPHPTTPQPPTFPPTATAPPPTLAHEACYQTSCYRCVAVNSTRFGISRYGGCRWCVSSDSSVTGCYPTITASRLGCSSLHSIAQQCTDSIEADQPVRTHTPTFRPTPHPTTPQPPTFPPTATAPPPTLAHEACYQTSCYRCVAVNSTRFGGISRYGGCQWCVSSDSSVTGCYPVAKVRTLGCSSLYSIAQQCTDSSEADQPVRTQPPTPVPTPRPPTAPTLAPPNMCTQFSSCSTCVLQQLPYRRFGCLWCNGTCEANVVVGPSGAFKQCVRTCGADVPPPVPTPRNSRQTPMPTVFGASPSPGSPMPTVFGASPSPGSPTAAAAAAVQDGDFVSELTRPGSAVFIGVVAGVALLCCVLVLLPFMRRRRQAGRGSAYSRQMRMRAPATASGKRASSLAANRRSNRRTLDLTSGTKRASGLGGGGGGGRASQRFSGLNAPTSITRKRRTQDYGIYGGVPPASSTYRDMGPPDTYKAMPPPPLPSSAPPSEIPSYDRVPISIPQSFYGDAPRQEDTFHYRALPVDF